MKRRDAKHPRRLVVGLRRGRRGVAACRRAPGTRGQRRGRQGRSYHCPMHPSYVSDKPGNCPICGMELVPMRARARAPAHPSWPAAPGRALAGAAPAPRRPQRAGPPRPPRPDDPDGGPGRGGRAAAAPHPHQVRGYVEHLVRRLHGQVSSSRASHLLSIYSPELVATQQEYLLAYRAQQQMAAERDPDSVAQGAQRPARGRAPAAAVLGHAPRRHRGAREHRAGPAHARPARRVRRLRDRRRWRSTACA